MSEELPPLPPRKSVETESEPQVPVPPELPPREPVNTETPAKVPVSYTYSDLLLTISVIRQDELYGLPQMNENSDLFTVGGAIGSENLKQRLSDLVNDEKDEVVQFWHNLIEDYSNLYIRERRINDLDNHLVSGIPENLRSLVYLKTLQIRYKIHHKETYESLVTKARYAEINKEQEGLIESLKLDARLKDIIRVFNYYTNEKAPVKMNSSGSIDVNTSPGRENEATTHLPPNQFIISISKVVESIPNLSSEEMLYVLLKLNKLYSFLIKEELFYKINRTLEDYNSVLFKYISIQGINLESMYKKVLFTFFQDKFEPEKLLIILDFIVFHGFDFILRLLAWAFAENEDKIAELEGDELNEFINSNEFFSDLNFEILQVLQQDPNVIKFENEYHLMTANSLNRNNNELMNLREVNDDLLIKINELNRQLENLRITHGEILGQSESYTVDLDRAVGEKLRLQTTRDTLQEKYEHLTMKENLKNTIKANEEFADRNRELEEQIAEIRASIEKKKAKLAKVAPAAAA